MNKKILGLLVLIIIISGGAIFYNKQGAPTVAPEPAKQQEIKLGLIFPLTSEFGTVAEGVKNASLLAVDDWKTSHPGVKVVTIIEDDGYQAAKGIAAYNKLKNFDHVGGILSVSTPVLDALHQTYQADGLPVINLGVQTEGVAHDNIFQIFPDAKGQVKPLADYLMGSTSYTSVTIVHSSKDAAYAQFYTEFTKLYTKPFKEVSMDSKEDSKVVATKVIASKGDAVVFILSPALGSVLTKDLRVLGSTHAPYYFDGSLVTGFGEYEKIVGSTKVLDGSITIKPAQTDMSSFKAEYKAKYGSDPSIFAEDGYDSAMVMLNSYNKNKATWVKNIEGTNYSGPSGKTTFDENGVRIPELVIAKVVDGKVQ